MNSKLLSLWFVFLSVLTTEAQTQQPIRRFLNTQEMKGASFSISVKNAQTGESVYSYDTERELIPASVMKLVTTATALEIMGEDFCFETAIEYDGEIKNGVLTGNLYIKGSGDPTLGSSHIVPEGTQNIFHAQQKFVYDWIQAIKEAGIERIEGAVIADDSIYDTEGVSMKWLHEDMGSYYGAGSYGINVFDNLYKLTLHTGAAGGKPEIKECIPAIPGIRFHNNLISLQVSSDSSYITGYPYCNDRYLHGVVPAGKEKYTLRGDIPDPALFLSQYLIRSLSYENIEVKGNASTSRLLSATGKPDNTNRTKITSTFSPPLKEIIEVINKKSHNLYTDAVLKTLGGFYKTKPDEVLSSFGKGVSFIQNYWETKGLDTSSLWMFDGSGLAPTDKLSTGLICDILLYMKNTSSYKEAYFQSLPKAGTEGSVRNFLKGSVLQDKARLKSGSMSRVKSYGGYVQTGEKEYVIAIIVNNYHGEGRNMTQKIEKLLLELFQ